MRPLTHKSAHVSTYQYISIQPVVDTWHINALCLSVSTHKHINAQPRQLYTYQHITHLKPLYKRAG